ncbi:MAG: glycosyltransferase [Verrucomicrobia bacterium]|nr:glycosyltransferase [Verrucomicrobiota bacterium]
MPDEPIVFSIIVPTYNRPQRLAGFLERLAQMEYPRERFEVVLVDDGSEPPLKAVADRFADRLNVTCLRQNHGGVAKGRQAGAEAARGRFLAFTDDDCLPATDWLRKLEASLVSVPDSAAGGRTLNGLPENSYAAATQALIGYLYAHMNTDPKHARFFANNNMAMPRNLYLKIGGLDTTWPMCGEDRDLCDRWLAHGYPMIYVADAIVHHLHDLTFARFWRQHYNYGRGAYRFHKTAAQRHNTGLRLERLSFYLKLPFAAFGEVQGPRAVWVVALLVVSQVANTAGFVAERISPKQAPPT